MQLRYENVRARETPRGRTTSRTTEGTVRGLGKGNFVDATFPAGDAGAVSQAIEPRKRAPPPPDRETFSKVTGNGNDHALRCTCSTKAAK